MFGTENILGQSRCAVGAEKVVRMEEVGLHSSFGLSGAVLLKNALVPKETS